MIFVTVGTQKFQFNRLLEYLDELVAEKKITEEVFAQIGNSSYTPKNYQYTKFLSPQDFAAKVDECNIYVTHGGVGSLVQGLKAGKQVIAIARLAQYDEHIDDHQTQITSKYQSLGYIMLADSKDSLYECIKNADKFKSTYKVASNGGKAICDYINNFIKAGGKI